MTADFALIREHAALTTQTPEAMAAVGGARITEERRIFAEQGWGEPPPEHLAAACYEAMVHWAIKRGLENPELE